MYYINNYKIKEEENKKNFKKLFNKILQLI